MSATPDDVLQDRLKRAREALQAAEYNLRDSLFDAAANRAYYAAFHAARALLGKTGIEVRKHSGVLTYFDREFVKTGQLEKGFSRMFHQLFDGRTSADYDDLMHTTPEQAQTFVDWAREFVEMVEARFADPCEQEPPTP